MFIRLIAAFALLLGAGPALAQKAPPSPAPPIAPLPPAPPAGPSPLPPAQPALAARAYAERLIEQAQADGLFLNVSGADGVPAARHVRSGLICRFSGMREGDRLLLFEPGPARPGDDVGCNTAVSRSGHYVTLYATRYRQGGLDEHYAGAIGEMTTRYRTLSPWTGEGKTAGGVLPDGAPPIRTVRYTVTDGGQLLYTRMSMVLIGEWTVMLRYSAPVAEGAEADALAGRIFAQAVTDVMAARPRQ